MKYQDHSSIMLLPAAKSRSFLIVFTGSLQKSLSSFGLSSNGLETLDLQRFPGSHDGFHPFALLALGGLSFGDVSTVLVSDNVSCLETTNSSDLSALEYLAFGKSTFGDL